MYNNNLLNVSKPARYLGGELNSVIKHDDGRGLLDFCLIFPDIYEIGSSHVGYRLLYELVNESEDVYCQRFFAPWPDALEALGCDAFVSLETGKPLKEFDVLGFSLHYEMSYTTTLAIIRHSGIPIRSSQRTEADPIIIAGGSCTFNPTPLSNFIDAFYIGEGDIGLRALLEDVRAKKRSGASRREILERINAEYPFMYVPSVDKNKKVMRDIYAAFGKSFGASRPIVPLMPAIQDRVAVEIARGCTAGCRFCQAGVIYRPVRERDAELVINDACRQLEATGHLEVSLLSLSTGDYSELSGLVTGLNARLEKMNVSLSTPSLRADSVSEELFQELSKVRKSGFTIAPEAGSQRMRNVINKNLTEEEIISAVVSAAQNGYSAVKLYFMIGLPFETDEDILAIATLASKIKHEAGRIKRGFDISVAVSHFVPKPHTPFEIYGQVPKKELERRMYMLKDELKYRKLKCKFHDTRMSAAEAFLSRGNDDTGRFLEYAAEKGSYLDAWDDFFDYEVWRTMASEIGVDIEACASKGYESGEDTPWGNIGTGVSQKFFEEERAKAENCEATADCRCEACSDCGVCDFKTIQPEKALPSEKYIAEPSTAQKQYEKYEITYSKKDGARFLSALEQGRVFSHSLRVSGADLKFTEGFNPQPRVVLTLPLSVGISGENEKLLIEAATLDVGVFLASLNKNLPTGLTAKSICNVDTIKTGSDFISTYKVDGSAKDIFIEAHEAGDVKYTRESKSGEMKEITLGDYLDGYSDGIVRLKATASGGFNLQEFFKRRGLAASDINITRLSVEKT